MSDHVLVFLGRAEKSDGPELTPLQFNGRPVELGDRLPLVRVRSPWDSCRQTERVIVGCDPHRADVFLVGHGIFPEHIRLYISKEGKRIEMRPLQRDSTLVNGRSAQQLEWILLAGGEELQLGPWRFRFELGELAGSD